MPIANAHGWEIGLARDVRARWSGGPLTTDLELDIAGPAPADGGAVALSAFGSGILTFYIPALFRTEPGYNLWVTGPVNQFKDGVAPLSAVVETDWLTEYGFTMNWKITRPDAWIDFARGGAICLLFPVPRGLCEGFTPRLRRLADAPELLRHVLRGLIADLGQRRLGARDGLRGRLLLVGAADCEQHGRQGWNQ